MHRAWEMLEKAFGTQASGDEVLVLVALVLQSHA